MEMDEAGIAVDDQVVVPFFKTTEAKVRRAARSEATKANATRGQRGGLSASAFEKLKQLEADAIDRLADLPDDRDLGAIARLTTMRTLVQLLTGTVKIKSAGEAIKVAEVSHRIAQAEAQAAGEAPATAEERAAELEALAAKARASSG